MIFCIAGIRDRNITWIPGSFGLYCRRVLYTYGGGYQGRGIAKLRFYWNRFGMDMSFRTTIDMFKDPQYMDTAAGVWNEPEDDVGLIHLNGYEDDGKTT